MRRIFTFLAAVSAVLFVVVVGSLEFEGGALFWCSNGPATESGEGYLGNVE